MRELLKWEPQMRLKMLVAAAGAAFAAFADVAPTEHVVHRGWGLTWPENSMPALKRCWETGFIFFCNAQAKIQEWRKFVPDGKVAAEAPVRVCGADVVVSVVQDAPGYNSWPMVQTLVGKVVCAYSKGSGHTIGEGARGVYARTSSDGGATWGTEVCVANDPSVGEVTVGKGLDEGGAMLLWVRRWGGRKGHDLYRTADGATFDRIASPELSPMPMQVTDVMSLWFAGAYGKSEGGHSWGTLTSRDNGRTWMQHTVEADIDKSDWPTELSAVYLGGGRILAVGRSEDGGAQFQIVSSDGGKTWKRARTNIRDVRESTPSLIHDPATGLVANYYYHRGAKKLKRRTVLADFIFGNPERWPDPETLAEGRETRPHDAGNVNATRCGNRHLLALYTGTEHDTAVLTIAAPGM